MVEPGQVAPRGADGLIDQGTSLIEKARAGVAVQAILALMLMKRRVGRVIQTEVLGTRSRPR